MLHTQKFSLRTFSRAARYTAAESCRTRNIYLRRGSRGPDRTGYKSVGGPDRGRQVTRSEAGKGPLGVRLLGAAEFHKVSDVVAGAADWSLHRPARRHVAAAFSTTKSAVESQSTHSPPELADTRARRQSVWSRRRLALAVPSERGDLGRRVNHTQLPPSARNSRSFGWCHSPVELFRLAFMTGPPSPLKFAGGLHTPAWIRWCGSPPATRAPQRSSLR
jgi:hypothetical protein